MTNHKPTDQEIACIQAIANGMTAKQAAFNLDKTVHQFSRLLDRARLRTSAKTTPELVAISVRNGWVQ